MQIKKVLGRIRQILGAAGRWLAHALRFRRGNLLDRLLRTVVILVLLTLAGGWLITNYALPYWTSRWAEQIPAKPTVECDQLAAAVKRELQFLMETEYAWLMELPKTQLALGPQVDLPEMTIEPEQMRPAKQEPADDVVEVWAAAFEQILWPIKGEVVTGYGWYRHPAYQDWRFHGGLEFAAAGAEQIRSVLRGRVESITPNASGFEVVINHGGGWQTVYSGIRSVAVKLGDIVDQNQVLAHAGDDGRMFFALLYEDVPVNPMQFMSLY